MSFLYPSLLWALFLIAIPIIIHLFNFKVHKVVYFSNIRFLENIKDVSESKSKIKNLIILLCRILAILSLVIAFSGPFKPLSKNQLQSKKNIVCVYLDNSFSMNAGSIYGNLFDAAKERIRRIVNSYDPSQKFIFITNDFEPKHRIITSKEQVILFLNQCQISPSFRTISEVISFIKNFLKSETGLTDYRVSFYLVSDFQKIVSDFEKFEKDSAFIYHLLPIASNKVNNLYIDSCWFNTFGRNINKQEELIARITNKGEESYSDIPLRLSINGKQKAVNSFSIEANQTTDVPIHYTNTETGILSCFLEISDYPITFDNKLFFNYQIIKRNSILVINNTSENKYIQALFKNDSSFNIEQIFYGNIKASELLNYQVIIMDEPENISTGLLEELKKFVAKGGVLVLMPASNTQIESFNKLMLALKGPLISTFETQEIDVGKINFQHFLYRDVFTKTDNKLNLPHIKSYFNIKPNTSYPFSEVIGSSSGKPLLIQHDFEKGKVYIFCFPLSVSNSDFVVHQLFVPTFYNIAAYSQGNENLYYIAGQDNILDVNLKQTGDDKTIHVVNTAADVDFIPYLSGTGEMGLRLDLKNNIRWADNYFLKDGDTILKCISFNFNRKESDTEFYTNAEIQAIINKNQLYGFNTISANINNLELEMAEMHKERKDFWKLFILIAVLSIVGEILVIRLWNDKIKTITRKTDAEK
jgi:hypothetical protein